MIVDNPFTEELQAAIKADDKAAELIALEKWRGFTAKKLAEAQSFLDVLIKEHKTFSEVTKADSLSKQYKKSIELYKKCRDLLLDIRSLKKQIREAV